MHAMKRRDFDDSDGRRAMEISASPQSLKLQSKLPARTNNLSEFPCLAPSANAGSILSISAERDEPHIARHPDARRAHVGMRPHYISPALLLGQRTRQPRWDHHPNRDLTPDLPTTTIHRPSPRRGPSLFPPPPSSSFRPLFVACRWLPSCCRCIPPSLRPLFISTHCHRSDKYG
ncbi:hypothetical protein PsYK624_094410 [Phanerochaete sordida]|uniref:Uncharacterized protein n=1 Tax=Phanerochaete sordida TaxID=48140 RepID=A0A9P3LGN7_9APHY|nr:hypothetical protein PsYK624_094410 [Phanerochaete sordida]